MKNKSIYFKVLVIGIMAIVFLGFLAAAIIDIVNTPYSQPQIPMVGKIAFQMKSVVDVQSGDGACSGWVLAGEHRIITAEHCLDYDEKASTGIVLVQFGSGLPIPFFVIAKGDRLEVSGPDIAILATSDTEIKWPDGFKICNEDAVVGESVHMLANPLQHGMGVTFGHISSVSDDLSGDILGKYADHMIRYDGTIYHGQSGGAVIDDEKGCVIGMGELEAHDNFVAAISYLTPAKDLEKIGRKL